MKRAAYWTCSIVMFLMACLVIIYYGITLKTILLLLILLGCPVIVGLLALRISKQTELDIGNAVKRDTEK
jgi:hypothetical protein